MQETGHRDICATKHRLGAYCVWVGMKEDVIELFQQCLHCFDSRAGDMVSRPFGEILGRRSEKFFTSTILNWGTVTMDVLMRSYLLMM